jgi:hypothetical protein
MLPVQLDAIRHAACPAAAMLSVHAGWYVSSVASVRGVRPTQRQKMQLTPDRSFRFLFAAFAFVLLPFAFISLSYAFD